MAWGVFEVRDGVGGTVQELHVVPCDSEGRMKAGHVADITCPCISTVEDGAPGCPPIVIHEEEC